MIAPPVRASRRNRSNLSLTQLEARDVPALWNVELLGPDVGYEGDTAADITGTLQLASTSVEAASPTEAVAQVLQGTIHVEHAGEFQDYSFGPTTIVEGQAFRLDLSGDTVVVQFEDLAGLPQLNPDWDYNDRWWVVGITESGTGGGEPDEGDPLISEPSVLFQDTFEYVSQIAETATVTVTVTADKPGFEGLFTWEYLVVNQTFGEYSGPEYGIGTFNLGLADPTIISNQYNSAGWDHSIDTTPNEPRNVWWSSGEMGPQILPGASALFRFTTPPRPIEDITGILGDAGYAYTAGGGAKGPGIEALKIEIIDKDDTVTETLKVAKWENAFAANNSARPKPNFIDLDRDRFKVRVTDPKANTNPNAANTVLVKVSTDSDNGNQITLTETGINTGIFVSKTLMLMSNDVDDDWVVDDGVNAGDNAKDDRTHKVKLDDKVRAEYGVGAGKIRTDATVPVKYRVKINAHNIKVNLSGTAPETWLPSVDPNTKADAAIKKAGEYLAQVGIKLVPSRANGNFSEVADPPPNVTNGNGIEESPPNLVDGKIAMTDEEKSLLTNEIQSLERTDIELYFVLRLTRESHGEAFPASFVPSAIYTDSIIIAKKLTDPSVIAHEIVHVLADTATHQVARWNLMYKQPLEFEAVYAKKRLTVDQETDIHTKRANPLLHAP